MKKIILTLTIILTIFIIGCSSEQTSKEELSKIIVTNEVQDMVNQKGEHKIVIWVLNNSDKDFTGQIKVSSKDIDGSSLGFDGFYPKNIKPNEKTYGITWLKVASTPNVETSVLGGTFTGK